MQAWIDTTGLLLDEGCPDLLDRTICQPGPDDPVAVEERELPPVSINTYRLTLRDPE